MALLLELNGDLPEYFPDDERRLYIFACPRKPCNRKPGCVRALRATRKFRSSARREQEERQRQRQQQQEEEEKAASQKPKVDLGASLFGSNSLTGNGLAGNANPFSTSTTSTSTSLQANPFAVKTSPPSAETAETEAEKPEPETETKTKTASTLPQTFAEKLQLNNPENQNQNQPTPPKTTQQQQPKPWPPQSAFPPPHPHFYLDADYETLSRPSTPTIPENVTIDNADEDAGKNSSKSPTTDLKDAFDSELDKAFARFSDRLGHNPEQILRYEFGGVPLLYSFADGVGRVLCGGSDNTNPNPNLGSGSGSGSTSNSSKVTTTTAPTASAPAAAAGSRFPRCEHCGGQRVFELQLVPHAITVLEEARDVGVSLDGMDWGTIILGVCARDCGPGSGEGDVGVTVWREEWVGVQWEG